MLGLGFFEGVDNRYNMRKKEKIFYNMFQFVRAIQQ
jgi:hypothetical protein